MKVDVESFVFALVTLMLVRSEDRYVKLRTDVDFYCSLPLLNSTWFGPSDKFIVINGVINSNLSTKYNIQAHGVGHILTLRNFSHEDKGIYRCHPQNNISSKSATVINVQLCVIPDILKDIHKEIGSTLSLVAGKENGLICKINPQDNIVTGGTKRRRYNVYFHTSKQSQTRKSRYECMLINHEYCDQNSSLSMDATWSSEINYTHGKDLSRFKCKCNGTLCAETTEALVITNLLIFTTWTKRPEINLDCVLDNSNDNISEHVYLVVVILGALAVMTCQFFIFRYVHEQKQKKQKIRTGNPVNNQTAHRTLNDGNTGTAENSRELQVEDSIGVAGGSNAVRDEGMPVMERHCSTTENDIRRPATYQLSSCNARSPEPTLNYIDIQIANSIRSHKIIIGDDTRTPYADIDITLRAEPLPDSDSSSEDNEGNDDFLTIEEMQSLMKGKVESPEEGD